MRIITCRRCGKEFKYRKSYDNHIKKHKREEMMQRRKEKGETCGTCSKYWQDIKRCKIWGPKYTTDPIRIFNPEDTCILFFGGYEKGSPTNFRKPKEDVWMCEECKEKEAETSHEGRGLCGNCYFVLTKEEI